MICLNTIPQQKHKNKIMKQVKQAVTNWHKSQSKDLWIVRAAMIISLIIGCLIARYFGEPNSFFDQYDFAQRSWIVFGTASAITLFFIGYIKGRFLK